jgi:hypothetical protein
VNLQEQIDSTIEFIMTQLRKYKKPVLAVSFGKDSMVMLHLLLSRKIFLPIIYYRDPWFSYKNRFADNVIADWKLEVHSYPPARVSLLHGKEIVALASEYQTGPVSTVSVLKNALEFKDGDNTEDFLCGVNFLTRPCGIFIFPWDVVFVAHRDDDVDQIYGPVPLHSQIVYRDDGPDYVFPLKEWSYASIWDYTERFNVPYQTDRYDLATKRELPDKTYNSDWYPVCIRCVDKRLHGQKVFCPKLEVELENVAGAAPEYGLVPDYFGIVKKG